MHQQKKHTEMEEIRVAKDNLSYQAQDGVLYSKDKKQLFSYPKSKKSETYNMPASVKKVEEFNALINLKYLKNLTLSKNLSVTPSCNDRICNNSGPDRRY